MTIDIRAARPADFEQLKPMLLDMGFVDDESGLARRFAASCQAETYGVLVAELEEDGQHKLVGYAFLHDYGSHLRSGDMHRTAKLDDLYTLPDFRRRGIARQLMKAAEAWAKTRPLRYIFWYANIGEAGTAYRQMGYKAADAGQEGFLFFEIDFGEENTRTPHPTRGS
ncbi:GNAT family N-acetyltransferase [Deinococcus puniceus]|uniref:Aminoglycoside acetyltransferase n=1 Tax=Deinococcus puniceus TaxID=1182568 RepID=A0A172T9V8_9DEIO|nr:GNAT family N-acetyltransferase [Deinococcus puniceus]ANE43800.1 aminoglycoside acetyltransferase [Deinococcus puniceus]